MIRNPSRRTDSERLPRKFFGTLVVLAGLFASVTTWDLWKGRREARLQAIAASQNIASLTAHEIARTIGLFDQAILAAISASALPGLDAATVEVRQRAIFAAPIYTTHFGVMLMTDATGQVLMESGSLKPRFIDVSDRLYFTRHRQQAGLGLLITPPYLALTTGVPTIGFSRRYDHPDGSFAGVVMGALEVTYFRDLIRNLLLPVGAAVTISTDDGLVLAQSRSPVHSSVVGAQTHRTAPPGLEQSSRAGDLPIRVDVTIPFRTVYAAWWRYAAIVGGANFVLVLALMAVARWAAWELRRRRAAELRAAAFAEDYRILAENTADVILRLGLDATLLYASPAARKILHCDPAEMCGQCWRNYVVPEDWASLAEALGQLRDGQEEVNAIYRGRQKSGSELWLEARMRLLQRQPNGISTEVIASVRDVTWQRTQAEQLSLLAATDGLTGVANRRRFDEWLDTQWRIARRAGTTMSLLMLDVDCFKLYNDCYGHVGGDAVLRRIAEAMRGEIRRPADLAARYGGEEFAVLLPDTHAAGAMLIAERIRGAVASQAMQHERSTHGFVTVSLGVASLTPATEGDAAQLVTQADLALYEAKRRGRNQVVSYTDELREQAA